MTVRWTGRLKLKILSGWISGTLSVWTIKRNYNIGAAQLKAWQRQCAERLAVAGFLPRKPRVADRPSWERRGKPPAWIKGKRRPSQHRGAA